MSARTRSRILLLVCALGGLWTPLLRANPIRYSTSGTVTIGNDLDHQLQGVKNAVLAPDSSGNYSLGEVRVFLVQPPHGIATAAELNSPFDIRLDFNNNLPSLELKGVINQFGKGDMEGTVTSVVSSNPLLDANLPAPFAEAVSDPGVLSVHLGFWDFGLSELPVSLSFQEPNAVPEPSTLAVFGVIAACGLWHTRRKRRPR